jgi:hypothetical protein
MARERNDNREQVAELPAALVEAAEAHSDSADHYASAERERLITTAMTQQLSTAERNVLSDLIVQEYRSLIDAFISLYPKYLGRSVTPHIFQHSISDHILKRYDKDAAQLAAILGATEHEIEVWGSFLPWKKSNLPGPGYCPVDVLTSPPAWVSTLVNSWLRIDSYLTTQHRRTDSSPAPLTASQKPTLRGRRSKLKGQREQLIRQISDAGHQGIKYCGEMDRREVQIPWEWRSNGCPATYVEAYKNQDWRKRIQDEKSRANRPKPG